MNRTPETATTARLDARFASVRGQTQLRACFAQAPLKIAKTFAQNKGIAVTIMDCSPGILAGDFYRFDWHLEANTHVSITTQGFTRVHPSRENPCRLQQNFRLENGAVLEFFPEPLMLYQDAALRSECEIEMASDSTLLFGEIICSGRVGHGESFAFHELQNRLKVRVEGRLVFVNQTAIRPHFLNPTRRGAWENFTHQGNFYVFSNRVSEALQTRFRAVLEANTAVWSGASLLESGGVVVSLLGNRAYDLQETIKNLREAARDFVSISHS